MNRCECENPLVFRGEETCVRCGRTARTLSTRLQDALAAVALGRDKRPPSRGRPPGTSRPQG